MKNPMTPQEFDLFFGPYIRTKSDHASKPYQIKAAFDHIVNAINKEVKPELKVWFVDGLNTKLIQIKNKGSGPDGHFDKMRQAIGDILNGLKT